MTRIPSSLRQEQREAILDALHYCMYADNRLVLAEDKAIADAVKELGWDSDTPVADYFAASIASVRRAKEEPGFRVDFLADIGARLGDASGRAIALKLCQKVAAADGSAADSEKRAIDELGLGANLPWGS